MKQLVIILLLSGIMTGCGGKQDETAKETPSQGSMTIYCDDQVLPLMVKEVAAYDSIYPQVQLTLIPISAREAVVKLLSGETKLIVIGRRFADDEKALVTKYDMIYGEYPIAHDALAVVVNKRNPVDTMSVATMSDLFTSAVRKWSKIQSHDNVPVHTIVPNATASSYWHLVEEVTSIEIKSADVVCDSASQIVPHVRSDPGAIGVVDWNQVWNDTTVKVLRIAGRDSAGVPRSYTMLHPAYIHLKRYPLLHTVYGYTTEGGPALAKGFMAFVCNADGQRIALAQNLVPATQIIRLREPE